MPAVVRVKRRIDEEPLSAFVLNGKRRRLEEDNASALSNTEELSTLLKFAGTIKEQDDTATTQFARLSKEEAKELVMRKTRRPVNATDKARQELRQHQQEQRFRVVNCLRTTLGEDDENEKEITIVDIEKHSANDKTAEIPKIGNATSVSGSNSSQASTSAAATAAAGAAGVMCSPINSDTDFVYDLYIPDLEQQADNVDLMDDNYLSVRAFDNLIYEDCYNNVSDGDEYDSEDSNQENYFGNEYPDEDDDAALNSDREDEVDDTEDEDTKQLRKGLEKFVFEDDDEENDEDDDSSSEDGGFYNSYIDPYVHAVDPVEEGFCDDVDTCDVDRYGLAYARYKARILKKANPKTGSDAEDDSSEEDDVDNIYKSDNDSYHSANESDD